MLKLKKREQYLFKAFAFLIGLGIFIFAVNKFGGFYKVFKNLALLKYGYLFVIANSFLWMLGYTKAWRLYFFDYQRHIRFLQLLKIKLCGEAVNFMTPLGFWLGDSVRVILLKKYFGEESHLRSVVVDRTTHSLSAQVFCLFGVLLIFTQDILFPLWLHLILILIYAVIAFGMLSLVFNLLMGKGLGFFEPLIHFLQIPKNFPKIYERIAELKVDLEYYADKPKGPFWEAFFWHLLGRFLGASEILIILFFLQGDWLFTFSIILTALSSFFAMVFSFIPGAVGIVETVYAQFFTLYGFQADHGIAMQIIRRMRVFFWVFVGILIIDFTEIKIFFRHRTEGPDSPSNLMK